MVRSATALFLIFAAAGWAQPGLGDAAAIRAGAALYRKRCGAWALVPRESVAKMRMEPATLMPEGFESRLDAQQLQNLLAYLDRQRAPATAVEIQPVAY